MSSTLCGKQQDNWCNYPRRYGMENRFWFRLHVILRSQRKHVEQLVEEHSSRCNQSIFVSYQTSSIQSRVVVALLSIVHIYLQIDLEKMQWTRYFQHRIGSANRLASLTTCHNKRDDWTDTLTASSFHYIAECIVVVQDYFDSDKI